MFFRGLGRRLCNFIAETPGWIIIIIIIARFATLYLVTAVIERNSSTQLSKLLPLCHGWEDSNVSHCLRWRSILRMTEDGSHGFVSITLFFLRLSPWRRKEAEIIVYHFFTCSRRRKPCSRGSPLPAPASTTSFVLESPVSITSWTHCESEGREYKKRNLICW